MSIILSGQQTVWRLMRLLSRSMGGAAFLCVANRPPGHKWPEEESREAMNGHLAAIGGEQSRTATLTGVYALVCSPPAFQGRDFPHYTDFVSRQPIIYKGKHL
jgi:hypothetical protein